MATSSLIATRVRLPLDASDAEKIAAIQANESLADWIGAAILARLNLTPEGTPDAR
jgi:hypothetical protein